MGSRIIGYTQPGGLVFLILTILKRNFFVFFAVLHGPHTVSDNPQARCMSALTFVQISVGLILPCLLMLWVAPPAVLMAVQNNQRERRLVSALSLMWKPNKMIPVERLDGCPQFKNARKVALWLLLFVTCWYLSWLIYL